MIRENIGEIAALATAFCWSFSATSFEVVGKKVGSLSVNYIRLVTGFIFISFFTIFTRGMFLPVDATTKNWIFLSISGLIGFFIGDIFLFQSYLEVGSRISMLIMAASPPITAILGYFVFGEKLSIVNLFGMALTLTITSIVPVTIIPLSILVFKEKVKFKEIIGAMVTVVGVGVLFLF